MRCCTRAACSAPTSGSRSARSTTPISNASGASRFSPRTPPSTIATFSSTSSTRPVTPISAARSSGPSRWSTGSCCSSMPPRGPCPRPASCCGRRSSGGCRPSSSSTRSTATTRVPPRCSTRSMICSSTSTPAKNRSTFPSFTRMRRPARPASTPPCPDRPCARCSTPSSSGFRLRRGTRRRRCRSWWRISIPATTWAGSRSGASSTAGWRWATTSRSRSWTEPSTAPR